jgi:hypothetical protein
MLFEPYLANQPSLAQRANEELIEESKDEEEDEDDFFSMENTREFNVQTKGKQENKEYTVSDW